MDVYKIRDIATKAVPKKAAGKIGSVGLVGPDQDPDDFSPISPWVMLSKSLGQLDFISRLGNKIETIDSATLDSVALNIGRAVLSSQFFPGTALCSVDMPTCARNERISPLASMVDTITNLDVALVREEMLSISKRIDQFEKGLG